MRVADLTSLLADAAAAHAVSGVALGILRDGRLTTASYGVADTSTGDPVTDETRFAVGSLGKTMVATGVARLAAAGRLSLDDRVAAHVPELSGVGWAERATVRDLLANRSRVPLSVASEFAPPPDADDGVLSRLASRVATAESAAPVWSYSNVGWCLLGRVLETVTGLVWEDAMRANVLVPLGLDQTAFTTDAHAVPHVSGHEATPDGVVPVEAWAPRAFGPAGTTALSTAADLLRLASAHLEDPSLAELRTTQAEVRIHGWLDAWCSGLAYFDWEGGPAWGWDGVIAGQRSILRVLPKQQGALVLLTNSGTGRLLYRSLFPVLLEDFGVAMPPLSLEARAGTSDLSRFAGTYAWPDRRWEVTATDAGLRVDGPRGVVEALPVDDGSFLVDVDDPDVPTITFAAFDGDGRPGVLYQMIWGFPRI